MATSLDEIFDQLAAVEDLDELATRAVQRLVDEEPSLACTELLPYVRAEVQRWSLDSPQHLITCFFTEEEAAFLRYLVESWTMDGQDDAEGSGFPDLDIVIRKLTGEEKSSVDQEA
jgi:hypothetical protein